MENGFDPIGLDKIKVKDWLEDDIDNIVIYLDKSIKNSERILLLKKSYFLNPSINNIYTECIINNGALMVEKTYENQPFTNIGFYLDKYMMINNSDFINVLKSKSRSFKLFKMDHSEDFISLELLELSQIKLGNKPLTGLQLSKKINVEEYNKLLLEKEKNIPFNEEVYFNELLNNALYIYTTNSYICINNYLRRGVQYFDTDEFKTFCIDPSYPDNIQEGTIKTQNYNSLKHKVKTKKDIINYLASKLKWDEENKVQNNKLSKSELIKKLNDHLDEENKLTIYENKEKVKLNIIDKVNKIDKCFLELAPRYSETTRYYYRGMKELYNGFNKINDSIINNNYLSLTSDPNVPYGSYFWNKEANCCYYRFKIQKGIPYINMVNASKTKWEKEILLPRNLKLTLKNRSHKITFNKAHEIYDVLVEMVNVDQFKIDTGCKKYDKVGVSLLDTPDIKVKSSKKGNLQMVPKNVVENLDPNIQKTKLPRCPKGTRRNKKTGLCESKTKKSTNKPTINQEKIDIITPDTSSNPKRLNDVLNNLITINGHGGFNQEKIIVPDWCQIMVPHVNGLDSDYLTLDASKEKLYEEDLYSTNHFNYKNGWRLYMPGDGINNLKISTFSDASSCKNIDQYHTLQKSLSSKCKTGENFNKFCPLYCTKRVKAGVAGYDYITYKGKRKLKIKACSRYNLKDLFDNLQESLSKISELDKISPKLDEPILLIPFTCNAKFDSKTNGFDPDNKEHLTDIYHKLYDDRYKPLINKPVKKTIKKKIKKNKPTTKKKITEPKKVNCKVYKKTKDPKCNDQSECEWVKKKGCLNKESQETNKKDITNDKPKDKTIKKVKSNKAEEQEVAQKLIKKYPLLKTEGLTTGKRLKLTGSDKKRILEIIGGDKPLYEKMIELRNKRLKNKK